MAVRDGIVCVVIRELSAAVLWCRSLLIFKMYTGDGTF
jgi:hypothetical protein